ncbi:serine hydrolase [Streptomyces sp. 4N509B]|uniref:serine hydrolase n=1 Tax=Streptomyces sp. 4N509B TaxID=3457413 RepID=UPI003FD346DB
MTLRIRPALVVNAALATALLAVVAPGDVARLEGATPAGEDQAAPGPDAAVATPPAASDDAASPGALENAPTPHQESGSETEPTEPTDLGRRSAELDSVLATALAPLVTDPEVRLSVAALSMESGQLVSYGGERFDTASIVKVDLLAALLLQAQDQGRDLTAEERELAEAMIQRSDNDATDALWLTLGGPTALNAANERLGLTRTQSGGWGTWGLTQTTSLDQIALLRAVFGPDSPLTEESRAYLRQLMGSVTAEQRWGISAASDGDFELKNGWLPRSQTGLWDVNSIGRVTVDGGSVLLAVVSDGHTTQAEGIVVVEAAARAAVATLTGATTGT